MVHGFKLTCCRYYYDKKQIAKSVEAFKLALDINPMYEGIWFTLGWAADLTCHFTPVDAPQLVDLLMLKYLFPSFPSQVWV